MTDVANDRLVDVRPMTPHIGAEIFGVDLRSPLPDEAIAEIRTALLKWKVVFFRDQEIRPAEQIAFGRRFDYIVRFRWEPGSIAFWDNRATAHRAPTDVAASGFERYMERITIAGGAPVGVDGFTSRPA